MPALIGDIHGNLEALEAVLLRISDADIVCLGDVVCYGLDSIECVRKSAAWRSVVAGSLDLALIHHDPNQWNPAINGYIERMRNRFDASPDVDLLNCTLESFGPEFTENGCWYFHGAPDNVRDWIFPEEIYCPARLDKFVDHPEHVYFGGGSHIPGIFRRTNREWEFTTPENGITYDLPPDEKTIVTIGSVGQPRDEDPRAAFAITTDTSIAFHRVDYDLELTQRKISDDPDTDNMHGERLPSGR